MTADEAGQRIDNYLIARLKGVPKSHIYRILRSGEVRINMKRAEAAQRVAAGDRIRVPPVRVATREAPEPAPHFKLPVIFEDEDLLVIDKPAGLAVHGGSGVSHGVIESLRAMRPQARFLELAHRLDRETSGVLLVAKRRAALMRLNEMLRDRAVDNATPPASRSGLHALQRVRLSPSGVTRGRAASRSPTTGAKPRRSFAWSSGGPNTACSKPSSSRAHADRGAPSPPRPSRPG